MTAVAQPLSLLQICIQTICRRYLHLILQDFAGLPDDMKASLDSYVQSCELAKNKFVQAVLQGAGLLSNVCIEVIL